MVAPGSPRLHLPTQIPQASSGRHGAFLGGPLCLSGHLPAHGLCLCWCLMPTVVLLYTVLLRQRWCWFAGL